MSGRSSCSGRVKAQGRIAKTGVMVGIGERDEEVLALFDDLVRMTGAHDGPRDPRPPAGGGTGGGDPVDIITIGQYLQPTRNHLPIDRWVTPERFAAYEPRGPGGGDQGRLLGAAGAVELPGGQAV